MTERIIDFRHPDYTCMLDRWHKWRLTYEGGDSFIDTYLRPRRRESQHDFDARRAITPSPSFAKSAVREVANSVFARLQDVTRRGGSQAYNDAVNGVGLGIDLEGKSMNQFIGMTVVPELLSMKKIGIYVDMPPVSGPTMRDQQNLRPYVYMYGPESIYTWAKHPTRTGEYLSLLLVDRPDDCCPDTGMPIGAWDRYRHVFISPDDGKVHVRCYDCDCNRVDFYGEPTTEDYVINLNYIPFICEEINDSLLADVANHQIALLNMESCDVSFLNSANFPFYIEQQELRAQVFTRNAEDGEAEAGNKPQEIQVGETQGRIYGADLNAPDFIHPSPEPLLASMKKQEALQADIRKLVHLALSTISPKMASAESKRADAQGLEAGLSYIGAVMEHLENRIAKIWSDYEGTANVAAVTYPKNYSLQTDEDRRKEVESLEDLRDAVPSDTYQKAVSKQMVKTLMGHRVSVEELEKINSEIDEAPTNTAKEEYLIERVKEGLLDKKSFAKITGMPEEVVDKAAEEHADRLERISKAQAKGRNPAARGMPDQSGSPTQDAASEKTESRQTDENEKPTEPVRGEGK